MQNGHSLLFSQHMCCASVLFWMCRDAIHVSVNRSEACERASSRTRSDSAAEGPAMHRVIFKLASIFYGKYIFKLFKILGILLAGKNATAVTWQVFNGTFCYSHITWPVCSPEFSFRFPFCSLCKMRTTLWVIWTLRISTFVILIYQDCAFYRLLDEAF